MRSLFKAINQKKAKLRELDPSTIQRIKEGDYLTKLISETEVSARKLDFYAGNCVDQEVGKFFQDEAKIISKAKLTLQDYYESITRE